MTSVNVETYSCGIDVAAFVVFQCGISRVELVVSCSSVIRKVSFSLLILATSKYAFSQPYSVMGNAFLWGGINVARFHVALASIFLVKR